MSFDQKLEEIIDQWIGDKIQNECKPFVVLLFIFLENKYMKDVQKYFTNQITNENYLYKNLNVAQYKRKCWVPGFHSMSRAPRTED
jgi:hypothetical protein